MAIMAREAVHQNDIRLRYVIEVLIRFMRYYVRWQHPSVTKSSMELTYTVQNHTSLQFFIPVNYYKLNRFILN